MATLIRMPAVMTGAGEAVIAAWVAEEGATVAVGDVLAEVETEKAVVELAAETAGVLVRRLAADGETVEVGAPVAVLGEAGEDVDLDALLGAAAALTSEAQGSADDGAAVGGAAELADAAEDAALSGGQASGGAAPTDGAPDGAAPSGGEASGAAPSGEASDGAAPPGERRFASPIARKMAREAQLDLERVRGTGPGGRIVRRDVESAIATGASAGAPATAQAPAAPTAPSPQPAASAPAAAVAPAPGSRVPHTPMRRAIARRLAESKATVPHFYVVAEPRVDALLDLRRQVNEAGDVRVSVNDLVVKAVAAAYRAVPEANVQWGEDEMTVLDGVDVAIAVATDGGLVTPVLRGVGQLPVSEVSRRSADLVARARSGRLRQPELEGGSITVSNLGMYGTPEFAAILNPPQAAILAVGAAVQQPVVVDGALAVGTVMRCVLSADHRAVDGALAARWAAAFTRAVENPLTILV
ncbi:dihydrolipoamide acetyltransferase family protein [Actinotalea sp. Marseille-Q4924]|uniref:dihydrolipoamide acetyltransferase family protein n=1 Tax=Actinotalea sp. Marseille-Q4924 TaxID=2866571 RepID=UPI001CE3CDAD|nr:dihydrolipoamide acetyltransferase family protein [Actinotalea sp. Marseille-Q4924]